MKRNALAKAIGGFAYLGILVLTVLMGVGLAAVGNLWSHTQMREKERELLFVGNQFREAIRQYYEKSPGGLKQYPKDLEDLIEDRRAPEVRRFLRRIYRDPMTNDMKWGLVEGQDGGIMGVYSLSDRQPLKQSGFDKVNSEFEGKERYSDWRFYYMGAVPIDLLPAFSANVNLVKSVFDKENGLEEALHRRTNHRIFEAGGSRSPGQGTVSAAWVQ